MPGHSRRHANAHVRRHLARVIAAISSAGSILAFDGAPAAAAAVRAVDSFRHRRIEPLPCTTHIRQSRCPLECKALANYRTNPFTGFSSDPLHKFFVTLWIAGRVSQEIHDHRFTVFPQVHLKPRERVKAEYLVHDEFSELHRSSLPCISR